MAYRKQLYYRIQDKSIHFADMQNYDSLDADPESDTGWTARPGVCATIFPHPYQFGGAWDAYDEATGEIVVMEGYVVEEIYDGYRIRPTREIARFGQSAWLEMVEAGTLDDILTALQDQ